MIIWRGFGFVAVILAALGALLGSWIGSLTSESATVSFIGVGISLGGAATFALGWWLNVVSPAKKTQTWVDQRGADFESAVASGTFQPSPGIVPASHAEARSQADTLLAQETKHVTKRLRNVHTLFWVPMQWMGVVIVVLGVVIAAAGSTS